MISVTGLGKSFGDRTLFSNVSLRLKPGERYGLVGANGSGKTTFLNVLAGDSEATAGAVATPRNVRLGVLRQDRFLYEDEPILDVTLMGNLPLWKALSAREEMLSKADEDFDVESFAELEETVQQLNGYTAEARAATILEGLRLPAAIHREPLSTLSGGFRLRVLLAQVLASSPDALLLDEPTNHLDILSIRWLEKFLRGFPGPQVLISHDHRFLDNVATRILDVDYDTILEYPGNYTRFCQAKVAERERREKEIASRNREIAQHQRFVDRFRAKASKARQAQSKLRLIEKKADSLEELPQSSRRYPIFRFEQVRPSGKEVVKVKQLAKSFGDNRVLQSVELRVERGDRVAVMGPNGIGKSTLLKILTGQLRQDVGTVEWGYETHPGYFAQDQSDHFRSGGQSAEAWMEQFCEGKGRSFVRGQMGMVLFSGEEAEKRLGSLSGGEAARLVLCSLMVRRPNVLVLDEPTNHLDLEAIDALTQGLRAFDGTLIMVSHDRWFVSRLADRIVEITADGMRDYRGTYDEYVQFCGDDHLDVERVVRRAREKKRTNRRTSGSAGAATAQKSNRAGAKSRRVELKLLSQSLFARIERAETRVGEIDSIFADPSYYEKTEPTQQRALEEERRELEAEVNDALVHWAEVEREIDRLR